MNRKEDDLELDEIAERINLRYVPQASVSMYEAVDAVGEVVVLLLAEAVDEPERFAQRTEAEQSAMLVLALDDYYNGFDWEGTIIDE